MGKAGSDFDPDAYAPVARRIRLFYERHPNGRIETQLVSRTTREVVFKALVYRNPADVNPAATGWAAEREGDGDINLVACLENTETSAIGRALANLGFTAAAERPSREEIAKASRARVRVALKRPVDPRRAVPDSEKGSQALPRGPAVDQQATDLRAMLVSDLLTLIDRAAPLGIRPARMDRWKAVVASNSLSMSDLTRYERRLRVWIGRQTNGNEV